MQPPAPETTAQAELGHAANVLRAVARHLTHDLPAAGAEPPLDHPSARDALTLLTWYEPASLLDIEGALGLSQPAALRVADRLAGAGLVERRRDRGDRRVWLTLTAAGRTATADLLKMSADPVARLIGRAIPNAADRRELLRLLDALARQAVVDSEAAEPFRFCRACDVGECLADGLVCPSAEACRNLREVGGR